MDGPSDAIRRLLRGQSFYDGLSALGSESDRRDAVNMDGSWRGFEFVVGI